MSQHIIHKHSNEVIDDAAKAPEADSIMHGELAVNYAAGNESVFMKNTDGDILPIYPLGGGVSR